MQLRPPSPVGLLRGGCVCVCVLTHTAWCDTSEHANSDTPPSPPPSRASRGPRGDSPCAACQSVHLLSCRGEAAPGSVPFAALAKIQRRVIIHCVLRISFLWRLMIHVVKKQTSPIKVSPKHCSVHVSRRITSCDPWLPFRAKCSSASLVICRKNFP